MKKRVFSILLIVIMFCVVLYGCDKNTENTDSSAFVDGTFKIGILFPSNDSSAKKTEEGFYFAHSLAGSLNLGENIDIMYDTTYYNDSNDVQYNAESLVLNGASVIVYGGDSLEAFNGFAEYISKTKIPAISLSPYIADCDNIFTLTLNPKYLSSCAATYATEKGYKTCAMLSELSDKYYSDFAEIYKSTLRSYIGAEPTVYYKSGELANYSASALASGNYDYLFLLCSQNSREELVTELRNNGFIGEIMFAEITDKQAVKTDVFNNCSFISKLESDSSNNVSTVFYSMYAESSGTDEADIQSATAYGYDAYMTVFEALKSFAPKSSGSVFSSTDASAVALSDIKLSDIKEAIESVTYYGVTDKIAFSKNIAVPTYIYVDNITGSEILFGSKYTFNADSSSAE